ncbi:MAG: tetratricopeptide repeat protein, partial [Gemmatimonadetes bacterium]|nr:tetratricopeptide repeat protein [Gemmatimonadota bacterium]
SEAIAAYTVATELDPSLVEAWERIAASGAAMDASISAAARERLTHLQSIDASRAETFRQLRVAILNSPEDPAGHYRLGAFLLENALTEEAVIKFQHVANLQPGDARLLNHMGGLLSRAERLDESLPFYLRAADARPDDPTALMNAGSVYAMRGEIELALPLYEKALARAPENPQVHYFYGLALTNAGNADKAREILQAGVTLAGDSEFAAQLQKALDTLNEDGSRP